MGCYYRYYCDSSSYYRLLFFCHIYLYKVLLE
nr:MAG TPA: hypothetical protein [Caudoviricetes sp.]